MADETVKVTETTKEYELQKADLVPSAGEDEPTWANKIAGQLDRFRVIPRLIMLAYIYAFIHQQHGSWHYLIPQMHRQHLYPLL